MIDYDELKKAAEAATPGPWEWPNKGSSDFVIAGPDRLGIGHLDSPRTAEYVALANPATILALISEREQQSQRIAKLEDENAGLLSDLNTAYQQIKTEQRLSFRDQVAELEAEVASLREDAERWRFVLFTEPYAKSLWKALPTQIYLDERHLNNAIDAARGVK